MAVTKSMFRWPLVWLALVLSFAAAPALSQPPLAEPAPRIDGFHVGAAQRLTAGNTLGFTLYGTPGGTASASISAVPGKILLDEGEPGVYEGTYTIKSRDRIAPTAAVTVNLRVGNHIATEILDEPLLSNARPGPPPAAPAGAAAPAITSFTMDPPAHLAPGEQIFFSVHGTPAGRAFVRIAGVNGKTLLEEVQSGVYEGAYTVKARDHLSTNAKVTAVLDSGGREVSKDLVHPLVAGPSAAPSPHRASRICANCGVVEAINTVNVKGTGTYLGKIGGGLVGGLLGSQIGSKRNSLLTGIAGAAGGAILGNQIEKSVKKTKHYEVVVRLQGGGTQTITYPTQPSLAVGEKVKVENGGLVPI